MQHGSTIRRRLTPLFIALAALLVVPLSACAAEPDPVVTRESLQEVTQEPEDEAPEEPLPEITAEECTPYLVITARGTGEPHRGQLLSPVARAIADARPDAVTILDLDYPADTDVNEGASTGVRLLTAQLETQADECPDQRFVLLGYSQGALTISDTLTRPEDRIVGAAAESLDTDVTDRIDAIVLYGDPRFLGSAPFNVGDYAEDRDGLLPRPAGTLEEYKDRIRDYCVAEDFICQARTTDFDEEGHVEYFDNGMQQDGAAFVITRLAPPTSTSPSTSTDTNTDNPERGNSKDADSKDAGRSSPNRRGTPEQ